MIKKFLGFLFILIALILGFVTLVGLPETVKLLFVLFSDISGYSIGYFIGNIFVTILLIVLTVYLIQKDLTLLKKKPKQIETINEIGKN